MRIIILKRLSLVLLALTMHLGTCVAEGLTDYYSSPASGSFYLYNVNQAQYLMRLSNNYPGLSTTPTGMATPSSSSRILNTVSQPLLTQQFSSPS